AQIHRTAHPRRQSRLRRNAIKSGIYTQRLIIPGEDPAGLEALRDDLYESWQPANGAERVHVDLMIKNLWYLQRLHNAFNDTWTRNIEDDDDSPYRSVTAPLLRPFNR